MGTDEIDIDTSKLRGLSIHVVKQFNRFQDGGWQIGQGCKNPVFFLERFVKKVWKF